MKFEKLTTQELKEATPYLVVAEMEEGAEIHYATLINDRWLLMYTLKPLMGTVTHFLEPKLPLNF